MRGHAEKSPEYPGDDASDSSYAEENDLKHGNYICKSEENDLKHGNYICKSEENYLVEWLPLGRKGRLLCKGRLSRMVCFPAEVLVIVVKSPHRLHSERSESARGRCSCVELPLLPSSSLYSVSGSSSPPSTLVNGNGRKQSSYVAVEIPAPPGGELLSNNKNILYF